MYPSFTNLRSFTSYKFSTLRMRALWDEFWAKSIGRDTNLAAFPKHEHRNNPNRKLLGTKDIRVEQIIGTFNRVSDFDGQFRPLSKHLSDRWVNTYITLERDGWSPILVHKIGEDYYVEDGHHRVSVARSTGMAFIEAKVWEYPLRLRQTKVCPPARGTERDSAKAYASSGMERGSLE
jgi:hypothetical protein